MLLIYKLRDRNRVLHIGQDINLSRAEGSRGTVENGLGTCYPRISFRLEGSEKVPHTLTPCPLSSYSLDCPETAKVH